MEMTAPLRIMGDIHQNDQGESTRIFCAKIGCQSLCYDTLSGMGRDCPEVEQP